MLILIELESETPIYLQLRNQIVMGVARGELAPGQALPSTRRLAGDLGVHMHTVAKAYNLLKAEGFAAIHQRGKVVVRKREDLAALDMTDKLSGTLDIAAAEAACTQMDREQFMDLCRAAFSRCEKGGES